MIKVISYIKELWSTLKWLYEPFLWESFFVFKAMILFSSWALYGIGTVMMIRWISSALENNQGQVFCYWMIWYIAFFFIYQAANWMMMRWAYVEDKMRYNLIKNFLPHYFELDNTILDYMWTGKIISIVQKGMDSWWSMAIHLWMMFPSAIITIFFALWVVGSFSPLYVFLFLGLLILMLVVSYKLRNKSLYWRRQRDEHVGEYTRQLVKMIMHKFHILQSGYVSMEIKKLLNWSDQILHVQKQKHTYEHMIYNMDSLVSFVLKRSLLIYVGSRLFIGLANYTDVVLVITMLWYVDSAMSNIVNSMRLFMKDLPTIEKFKEFISQTPSIKDFDKGIDYQPTDWKISLDSISFQYDSNNSVFDNLSFSIVWWEKIAFVWPSGSGKSTLLKIILWFLRPNKGKLIVDGNIVGQTISLKSYYQHIGYLSQEPNVFDGTVRENLMYGIGDHVESSMIENVINHAQCQFIYDLPKGLDTEIWEKGIKLSGWQRQRLAIAKIMLKNPKIILLDEPTSALDSMSEELLSQAMQELFKDRTVVIIAHRLQTVKHADRILYIDGWKIVESWIHNELIALWWKYAKMVEIQTGF